MDYYAEITRMTAERKRSTANRSVLEQSLFIVLVGEKINMSQAMIREELCCRWSNGGMKAFVSSISIGPATISPNLKRSDGLTTLECTIGRNESASNKLFYLNKVVHSIINLAAEQSGNLTHSIICMVSHAEDHSAQWVMPLCMLLNDYLCGFGGSVSRRQYYCFLPSDANASRESLRETVKLCRDWEKGIVPEGRWRIDYDNKDMPVGTLPCNRYITERLFNEMVFLGRHDSDGNLYDKNGERVALFANIMDPTSGVVFSGGICGYSAYTYPSQIDQSTDIILAWQILHDRFINLMKKDTVPDLVPLNERLVAILKECGTNVMTKMLGFCLYNEEAFINKYKGKSDREFSIIDAEKDVFGNALQYKFDYLWLEETSSMRSRTAIETWKDGIRDALAQVYNDITLDTICSDPISEDTETDQALSAANTIISIHDLVSACIRITYMHKNTKEVKQRIIGYGTIIKELAEKRRRTLKTIHSRADKDNITMDIKNTKEQIMLGLKPIASGEGIWERRDKQIQEVITALDEADYARAIAADDYQQEIVGVLKTVATVIEDKVEPEKLSQPNASMYRCACQVAGPLSSVPLTNGYPRLHGGRGSGLYYLAIPVEPEFVHVFNEACK